MTNSNTVTTCSVDDLQVTDPSPGEYVEIDDDLAVIETIVGGRARINYAVQSRSGRTETYGTDELDNPSPGDFVTVDGERGIVEEILGGRVRVNLSVE